MIETGTILQNRYLIDKQIGAGGMGAVYVATDQRFGSTVAIKETFFTDENLRKAFEREARLLNSLRHPALVRVSDHFDDGNGQFLVMEYIPGEDLSELMISRGTAFSVAEVMTWADQLLDALDYLHTQEMPIVHRDIKPQNLKLTSRGQIMLLDFGLAKGNPANSDHQTNTKSVFGFSRIYAPLEQIQGTGTDPRSDFYSLAATMYHLLTGAPPEDALTRATAVLNGNPDPLNPLHALRPEISTAISDVIMKAMALNANYRPSSAAAMRVLLNDARNDISPFAGEETLVAFPAGGVSGGGIFDQKTQVIGGENTVTASGDAMATEQNRAAISGGIPPIEISSTPATEVTRVSSSSGGVPFASERKRSRAWLGMGAGTIAVLLAGVCCAALYVYKPELFGQGNAPVNTITSENAVPASTQEGAAEQTAEATEGAGSSKESASKTSEPKESKPAGEKTATRAEVPSQAKGVNENGADPEEAEVNIKQKEFEKAVKAMVNKKMKQANARNRTTELDEDDNDPDDTPPNPNVRIFRPGDANLPPPRKPYVFRRKHP
ncbi:MAG TPA: serine/threonine-protein kinase [Pyrinomonadaceae bacterium]|jgi:serine/threonine protein kinase|nr:serine/threonine-protein kinase [Pyrinomonadaceae bacterium]